MDAFNQNTLKIVRNTEACVGCRTCELACSFHHHKGLPSEEARILL